MTKKNEPSPSYQTRSGVEVKKIYSSSDVPNDLEQTLGRPGEFPFTRGVQKDMYRGKLWTMRQYAGFGSAEESNARYRYLLAQGTTGLSVAFDLPTQLGYDPDHSLSRGEVGKVGVSIATVDDMRVLFHEIDLTKVSTSMTINATAAILLAFYVVVAEEKGAKAADLRGTVQNDVLKEYIARGNYIYPAEGALRIASDMFAWCAEHTPKWNPISISGYHIREAGSTAVQELAFTFSDAIAYVEYAIKRGLKVDQFAGQLSFFFNVHSDFFEEIAKFRAARRIWATLMKDRFGALDPRSWALRFHSQTAGSTLTAQQPYNNVVRVSYQAMASVLGGTQSLHTNSLDEALALPTESSAKLALRTQQVLAYETKVTQTVDPLAGSYFIENLTSEIEKRVWDYLAEVESRGGTVACIESGWIQTEIANSSYQDQKAMDSGELKVVGVNAFAEEGAALDKLEILKIPAALQDKRIERVKAYKSARDLGQVTQSLEMLKNAARSEDQNLMQKIYECARAQASLGEIADALREVFGTYKEYSGY